MSIIIDVFERFTERARRCIFFARQSATKYGSQTIETEHFLLGILHEDPDVMAIPPLEDTKEIRAEVEGRLIKNTRRPPRLLGLLLRLRPVSARIDVPLSLPGKRIIAYGAEEAERLHHRRINLEHILMGVVREGDGAAGQMRSAGLNVINMREQMLLDATATE